jgi:hypothetical protein
MVNLNVFTTKTDNNFHIDGSFHVVQSVKLIYQTTVHLAPLSPIAH